MFDSHRILSLSVIFLEYQVLFEMFTSGAEISTMTFFTGIPLNKKKIEEVPSLDWRRILNENIQK